MKKHQWTAKLNKALQKELKKNKSPFLFSIDSNCVTDAFDDVAKEIMQGLVKNGSSKQQH